MKRDIIIIAVVCLFLPLISLLLFPSNQVETPSPCETAKIEIIKAVDKGHDQQTLNILGEAALKICRRNLK